MIFIRHAEPDKNGNLTPEGLEAARAYKIPKSENYFSSDLPRSMATMRAMTKDKFTVMTYLREWDKKAETQDEFKARVLKCLKLLPPDAVVVGHARFMNWAYFILTGNAALGFDYLESFEA